MKTKLARDFDNRRFQRQSALRWLHKLQGDQYHDEEIIEAAEMLGWSDPLARPVSGASYLATHQDVSK